MEAYKDIIYHPFSAKTGDVTVRVQPIYLDVHSNIAQKKFVFSYLIKIENGGRQAFQLLRRHWYIEDARGSIEEVSGDGVVGLTPHIQSGCDFEYNSFCILKTPSGKMWGEYTCVYPDGEEFIIRIPEFLLEMSNN